MTAFPFMSYRPVLFTGLLSASIPHVRPIVLDSEPSSVPSRIELIAER